MLRQISGQTRDPVPDGLHAFCCLLTDLGVPSGDAVGDIGPVGFRTQNTVMGPVEVLPHMFMLLFMLPTELHKRALLPRKRPPNCTSGHFCTTTDSVLSQRQNT